MKKLLLSLLTLITVTAVAQEVTDEQYNAANAAIEAEATYHIYTFYDGDPALLEAPEYDKTKRLTQVSISAGGNYLLSLSGTLYYGPAE